MPTNTIYEYADKLDNIACSNPTTPVVGKPVRLGNLTGVCLVEEGEGGNAAGRATIDFGLRVYDLSVIDTGGAGIAVGDTLFYQDGAPGTIDNTSTGYFFGFALEAIGAGLTDTIRVLHVPSPAAGALGAGTVGTTNLAANALAASAAGRGKVQAGFFDEATVLDKFAADSMDNAELIKIIKDGAFNADANTRALFDDGIWTQAKLDPASLDGTVAKVVADVNVIGGIPLVFRIAVADAATGDVDVVSTHKVRVIDAWAVKTGGAGGAANTVQVKNGANAITNALDLNINDAAVARAATIDDAQHEIAAGGTLRVTRTKAGGNAACIVYVSALRVA